MTFARFAGLCLSLLLAGTTTAQFVGPEVLSSPFTSQAGNDPSAAASIARLGQSAVIAWPTFDGPGAGSILLARLDGRLNAIVSLAVPTPGTGTSPSLATDGSNILLVWSDSGVKAALFDRDLNLLAGPRLIMFGEFRGHAASAGDTFLVAANATLFRFKRDTFESPEILPIPLSPIEAVSFNGTYGPTFVGIETKPVLSATCPVDCGPHCWVCPVPLPVIGYSSTLHFEVLYRDPLSWTSPEPISFRAMASGATDTAMIWRTASTNPVGYPLSIGTLEATVIPGLAALPFPGPLKLEDIQSGEPGFASAAWDGVRYAVVWQSLTSGYSPEGSHGIRFATIENGAITLQTLLVDSPADEVRPFIVATAPGQYIVGYEVINGSEHRLAGRTVLLNPTSRKRPAG